jgi:hypothetical protein
MRKEMLRTLALAAFVFGTISSAAAQPPPGSPRQQRAGAARAAAEDLKAEQPIEPLPDIQLAAMLDTYAIVQAQQQLSIPDDKYGAFAARLKRLQDTRRRNQRMRVRIVQELRRLAGAKAPEPVDENAIKTQLGALREHDARSATELLQAYAALDEVLDPRQQARFRIFEEVIEQRKLDLLVRARERARVNRPAPGAPDK